MNIFLDHNRTINYCNSAVKVVDGHVTVKKIFFFYRVSGPEHPPCEAQCIIGNLINKKKEKSTMKHSVLLEIW